MYFFFQKEEEDAIHIFLKYDYYNTIWEMLNNKIKIKWAKLNTIIKFLNH